MFYRGWINGKKVTTANLNELISCESIDIFISGMWQVYK